MQTKISHIARALIVLGCLSMSGCSAARKYEIVSGLKLSSLMFAVEPGANDGAAIRVHLVIIYDDKVVTELERIGAPEYFTMLNTLTATQQGNLRIFEWTFPSAQYLSEAFPIDLATKHKMPLSAMIFVQYIRADRGKFIVPRDWSDIKITFGPTDISAENLPRSARSAQKSVIV